MNAAEPILEPDLPIIDPHHHLWTETHGTRYMTEEFLADATDGHKIVATIFAECASHYREDGPEHLRCVGETEFADRIARESLDSNAGPKLCAGIVAKADLMLGGAKVAEILDAHRAASPTRFRGIRRMTAWDEDPQLNFPIVETRAGMMSDAQFRAGFAELQKRGLVFDAWLYHPQLGELEALARAFPQTTIVLDHIGTPLRMVRFAADKNAVFADWKAGIQRLAACPNIVVKLGGLGMAFCAPDWVGSSNDRLLSERMAESTRNYYLSVIDLFTPTRCMFESNFPVDKESTTYRAVWNSFKRITAGFSAHERAQLFYGTAARIYSIDLPK